MVNESFFFYGFIGSAVVVGVAVYSLRLLRGGGQKKGPDPVGEFLEGKAKGSSVAEVIAYHRTDARTFYLDDASIKKLKMQYSANVADTTGIASHRFNALCGQLSTAGDRYRALDARRKTGFDELTDVSKLKELWRLAFGDDVPFERESKEWSKLGFQGLDPKTDLRGGGILALDQFLYFATHYRAQFLEIIRYNDKQLLANNISWFLTAVVSIQFTVQVLTLECIPKKGANGSKAGGTIPVQHLRLMYSAPEQGARDGWHELHCRLLLHFFKLWKEDSVSVMEYTQWVPKVFNSFFSSDFDLEGQLK